MAYNGVNEYYKTEEEYVYVIAEALRQEYLAIHQAGFILQVDDAVLANMYDHLIQQEEGAYQRWAQLRVEALNHALTGIPEDRIRYHVITHHTTTVEHPRLVAQRLERFARLLGPENVIGGADCGFAQVSHIKRTAPEVVWAKFASLVAGAQIASQRIWGS